MSFARSLLRSLLVIPSFLSAFQTSSALDVPLPQTAATASNAVYGNFLGISFELSFLDKYCKSPPSSKELQALQDINGRLLEVGTDETNAPQPFLNHLSNFEELLSAVPLRFRIGGNSMDSSTFNESQTQFSVFTDPNANANDQPVNYGPLVFKVMDAVGKRLGGVEYLIGETGGYTRSRVCLTPEFADSPDRFKLTER